MNIDLLIKNLSQVFAGDLQAIEKAYGELTIEVSRDKLKEVMIELRNNSEFAFDVLIDVCGVDYLTYGVSDWQTESATLTGFCRGVEPERVFKWDKPRFGVVYHLLSITLNHRLRVKVYVEDSDHMVVPSVHDIWKSALWFEREAYDLYGILFESHPDLRRILTDYGFIGHPFRKDFPLSGYVEMRYDQERQRVIYQPITIEPREITPRVIREEGYGAGR